MVLLTMTPAIVAGLHQLRAQRQRPDVEVEKEDGAGERKSKAEDGQQQDSDEPPLDEPAPGKPIAHSQIVNLWRQLQAASPESPSSSLEKLLQGSMVYVPPPPPKQEPVRFSTHQLPPSTANRSTQSAEYKALMARLRRAEEARAYERMVNPPSRYESFDQRFPHAQAAYAAVNRPSTAADEGDDDVTYDDVHRQVMLIINFMVSIAGVAGTLWVLARWWSLPARLFLTMGGSLVVGIAEVTVYSVYVWRMGEAKGRQGATKEVKEVVQTWVVGEDEEDKTVLLADNQEGEDGPLRRRNPPSKESDLK
ncbi:hypothetical protein S7711_03098 [Stachybotrys chartarum IBT 7711]|uniref:Uncharacterized protein n=1 Tax=Stachybotrys chartarum (strain CBS 109288 / IBT 7711) TaxID=1280523 RepID=A0A084B8B4_STACB|nr:hypothetical protein S7711_03098 [Stachybotrys chartarum IBT 7711]